MPELVTRYFIDPLALVFELGMTTQPGDVISYNVGTGLITLPARPADIVLPLNLLWQTWDRALRWTNELVLVVATPGVPCSYKWELKSKPNGKWRSETSIAGSLTEAVYSPADL